MASGLPDYLSVIRPQYGGARQRADVVGCVANVPNLLTAIEGKGMIYGGMVWLDHDSSQRDGEIVMKLDGTFLRSPSFLRMSQYGFDDSRCSIFTIRGYDNTEFIYSAGLSFGITFEEYCDVYYDENNGTEPTVHYLIVYARL